MYRWTTHGITITYVALSISGISATNARPLLLGPGYIVMCVRILIYVMDALSKRISHQGKF